MFRIVSILMLIVILTRTMPKVCAHKSKTAVIRGLWIIFVVYLIGNLYCTIFSRVLNSGGTLDLRPFKTYFDLFRESFEREGEAICLFAWFKKDTSPLVGLILNILLYYPLGYLLPILFPKLKPKLVIFIGCLCSVATEATQYFLKMGWCETDDVIHNTLGTAIGVWVWHLQLKRLYKHKSNKLSKD